MASRASFDNAANACDSSAILMGMSGAEPFLASTTACVNATCDGGGGDGGGGGKVQGAAPLSRGYTTRTAGTLYK